MALRDIRQDLKDRLDTLASDRAKLQSRLDEITALEKSVKTMLHEEETRMEGISNGRAELPFPVVVTSVDLQTVLRSVIKTKNRPLATDEIRDEILRAKAFDFGIKKPGRVVHFGLVSMTNSGELDKLPDGRWALHASNNRILPRETTH